MQRYSEKRETKYVTPYNVSSESKGRVYGWPVGRHKLNACKDLTLKRIDAYIT